MTPEAQRIAIAEVCGWTNCEMYLGTYAGELYDFPIGTSPTGFTKVRIPDYLNDLNAMYEAEKHIGSQLRLYASNLQDVCGNYAVGVVTSYEDQLLRLFHLVHATAPQRAEAFLRTLGLWKSS